MTAYRLHQPLPLGVPQTFGKTARVYVDSPTPDAPGRVVVDCDDDRFASVIRARLARCYGFRGRLIGEQATQNDLHCAMALGVMRELKPMLEPNVRR